jgi:hypothetical protein
MLFSWFKGNKDMSRFLLDNETIERIAKELPDLENLGIPLMKLFPDFISIKYPAESNVPVAAICLQDTLNSLLQVRIGLNTLMELFLNSMQRVSIWQMQLYVCWKSQKGNLKNIETKELVSNPY